jgi:hypothetical protein
VFETLSRIVNNHRLRACQHNVMGHRHSTIMTLNDSTTIDAMYVQRNSETPSPNHCCSGKAISIKYYECVSLALVILHAKRMRRIILSSVACMYLQYFSTLSHKRHNFCIRLFNSAATLAFICPQSLHIP